MKRLPTRDTRTPSPRPSSPTGQAGRLLEPPMRMPTATALTRSPFCFLIALALLPTGCFDPMVTEDVGGGSETDEDTTVGSAESGTTEGTTAVEPDSGSGEPLAVCGDGVVEGMEVCDDGVNDGGYGGCSADCSAPGPWCGDGIVNGEEPCDDGDDVDGNGCNVDCVVSGSVLWTVTYDGPDHEVDYGGGVAVDPEDNIIVVGNVASDGNSVAWVRQYTPEGAAAWTQFFPAMVDDSFASSTVTLNSGDVVFGGGFDTASGTNPDAWLRRLSGIGDPLWTETYASPQGGWDGVIDLARDEDGYLYALIEENQAPTPTGYRAFLRKYTPDGAELWTSNIDNVTRAHALATEGNGSCILVGNESQAGVYVPHLSRRTSDGTEEWSRTYPEYDDAYFTTVDVNESGHILAGLTSVASADRVLSIDIEGTVVDELFPHGEETTLAIAAILNLDNGEYVAAGIKGDDGHLWTSKYSVDGLESWTHIYNGDDWGLGLDTVSALASDSAGNIIAVGNIQDVQATVQDIWVTKFAP